MDFSTFHNGPNKIGRCHECKTVFRIVDGEEQIAIDAIYTSEPYSKHEEPHMIVVDGYDKPVTMPFMQAKLISPFLGVKQSSILDIGCFDGLLLSEIEKICNVHDLCGFDVIERPRFPVGSKYRFVKNDLDSINGQFDMILMSQSIQYIRDVHRLFQDIRRLLKPNGQLFIQVPDFSLKPCSLLLGDLYYHYNRIILKNMLNYMGFGTIFLDNPYFPRDILTVASFDENERVCSFLEDFSLDQCLSRIDEITERLDKLEIDKTFGVLGTTIEGAFVSYHLKDRISFFVDENPKKIGTEFQGKKIIHPESVLDKDVVIIPMGKSGEGIQERLSKKYRGNYLCL